VYDSNKVEQTHRPFRVAKRLPSPYVGEGDFMGERCIASDQPLRALRLPSVFHSVLS
jgi:hypothetical protein